jgi:hypothetical protein
MVGGKQDLLPKLSFHRVTNCCLLFVETRQLTRIKRYTIHVLTTVLP